MNSRNQSDDLFDLSLRHSLKNWAVHRDPPPGGRDRLLAAAREEVSTTPQQKSSKSYFGWFFRFQENQEVRNTRPIYNFALDSVYSLRANMAIL